VVICHGASDAKAIKNGIRCAESLLRGGVEEEIAASAARVIYERDENAAAE
jgi:fatty acid/phospholipid biosynthesis enzyme